MARRFKTTLAFGGLVLLEVGRTPANAWRRVAWTFFGLAVLDVFIVLFRPGHLPPMFLLVSAFALPLFGLVCAVVSQRGSRRPSRKALAANATSLVVLALAFPLLVFAAYQGPALEVHVSNATGHPMSGAISARLFVDGQVDWSLTDSFDLPTGEQFTMDTYSRPSGTGNLTVTVSLANGTIATRTWSWSGHENYFFVGLGPAGIEIWAAHGD